MSLRQESAGFSTAIRRLAKAQGATLEDLSLLRTAWSDSQSGGVVEDQAQSSQVVDKPLMFGNEPDIFDFEEESTFLEVPFETKTSLKPHIYAHPCGLSFVSDEITIDVWGRRKTAMRLLYRDKALHESTA